MPCGAPSTGSVPTRRTSGYSAPSGKPLFGDFHSAVAAAKLPKSAAKPGPPFARIALSSAAGENDPDASEAAHAVRATAGPWRASSHLMNTAEPYAFTFVRSFG